MSFSVTLLIIIFTCMVSIPGFSNHKIIDNMIFWPPAIKERNQYYRFITCGFIHADYMHLIFNMFTLYFFGRNIEAYFKLYDLHGSLSYIGLYLSALVISIIPTYLKHQNSYEYRSLGASGAVSAVVTATILFDPWSPIYIYGAIKLSAFLYAILYIAYCIYASKRSADNINHDAHLWGSVYGFIFSGLLIFAFKPDLFHALIEQLKEPHLLGRPGR
jgi:membrane associated rhomboid family serine protease